MPFLKENWVLTLIALATAVLLAVIVHREADLAHASFTLAPNIQAPPGQRVKEPLPGFTVRIDLEGKIELIRQITADDLRLTIDTSIVRETRRTSVPIEVSLPDKYDDVLIDWRPRSVQVRFEADAQRELPVLVKPLNPPDGWELREAPRASPSRVVVSGPREAVNRVASVVAPFTLEADERISTTATLQALAADGSLISSEQVRIEPPQVTVNGLQERVVLQKRVPVQPIFKVPGGMKVAVESVTPPEVQLVGPRRLVSDIYVVETEPIPLPGSPAQVVRDAPLAPPRDGVQLTPGQVRVRFRIQPLTGSGAGGR
jgi:YbbR domain-containing protein